MLRPVSIVLALLGFSQRDEVFWVAFESGPYQPFLASYIMEGSRLVKYLLIWH